MALMNMVPPIISKTILSRSRRPSKGEQQIEAGPQNSAAQAQNQQIAEEFAYMIQGFLHGHLRHVTANNLAEAQVTEQQKPDRQGGDQGILAKILHSHQARNRAAKRRQPTK